MNVPAGNTARATVLALAGLLMLPVAIAEDPSLPSGLDEETDGPSLPAGLEGLQDDTLPPGPTRPRALLPEWLEVSGFVEARGGLRTQHDRRQQQVSLGELRFQLELEADLRGATLKLTTDFVRDYVVEQSDPDFERGQGAIDLREAYVSFSPARFMDVKVGRQILTWGTGDLRFINDLFPKDWQSFLIGRDIEYLKAPSDAIKVSVFGHAAALDLVFTPLLDTDRYISGRRVSFYNPALGRRSGRDAIIVDDNPERYFRDSEAAARLSRTVGGFELAAYGYWGYWKSPGGSSGTTGNATFPRLSVYGASTRGPLAAGIANAEIGFYESRQDRDGDNPLVNNSEVRFLAGFERELPQIARDLTVGGQYYLEFMTDYADYRRTLPAGAKRQDRAHHILSLRATWMLMNQNLILSLFSFYSPSDSDAHFRPKVTYKIDDHLTAEVGGNVFIGANSHTFFSQFRDNSNVYASLRWGF